MYTYVLRQDVIFDDEGKEYTVYGIDAVSKDGRLEKSYKDIFFDKQKAENFVNRCNQNQLSIVHLKDAVEDALTEHYAVYK